MSDVAVVTGASRGIGAAVARLLGSNGYAVAVNYRAEEAAAQAVVADIESAGGRAIAVQADVSRAGDVRRMFETVDERLGTLTALVGTGEQPVLSAERHRPDGAFGSVVVDLYAAVLDIAAECCPAGERIADGLGRSAATG